MVRFFHALAGAWSDPLFRSTAAGKVFTMVYVFLGVGVLVAFVTRLAQALGRNPVPG